MSKNSLTITFKDANMGVKDLSDDYHGVVLEGTDAPKNLETANVVSQEWYGEEGEEVYIPSSGIKFKAYDWKVKVGFKGTSDSEVKSIYDTFVAAIKTGAFNVKYLYNGVQMNGCYIKNIESEDFWNVDGEAVVLANLTIRVTEP